MDEDSNVGKAVRHHILEKHLIRKIESNSLDDEELEEIVKRLIPACQDKVFILCLEMKKITWREEYAEEILELGYYSMFDNVVVKRELPFDKTKCFNSLLRFMESPEADKCRLMRDVSDITDVGCSEDSTAMMRILLETGEFNQLKDYCELNKEKITRIPPSVLQTAIECGNFEFIKWTAKTMVEWWWHDKFIVESLRHGRHEIYKYFTEELKFGQDVNLDARFEAALEFISVVD